jgi:pyridoxamine 5'-phosphate oxidase
LDKYREAIARFGSLYERVQQSGLVEPTAVTLATANAQGQPSMRTVLLKSFDADGFVFYTNGQSRKAEQMAENARVALLFFWQTIFEQVCIEGTVSIVDSAESDAYWRSRPRDSQIGGWASLQSQPVASREALEAAVRRVEAEYEGREVPRPPYWQGYRVQPNRIEFWVSQPARLHDRECYEVGDDGWTVTRLFP